ncbi:MAG TPA: hypothetical protein VHS58_17405, partial [Acetobacteraceae bacterium]|nr:hypothetical protein [Acetobacteraceae bacterium]
MAAVDDGKTPSIVNGKGPGSFAVLAAHPLPGAGGGLRAFAVRDEVGERPDLMAVQTRPDAPPRAPAISTLAGARIAGVLTPVAVTRAGLADGQQGLFVVGAAPPGPPLAETLGHSWPDHALIEGILRPAALALSALEGWRV